MSRVAGENKNTTSSDNVQHVSSKKGFAWALQVNVLA